MYLAMFTKFHSSRLSVSASPTHGPAVPSPSAPARGESTVERQRQVELEFVGPCFSVTLRVIPLGPMAFDNKPTSYISPYGA